jgi:hypothetical protein
MGRPRKYPQADDLAALVKRRDEWRAKAETAALNAAACQSEIDALIAAETAAIEALKTQAAEREARLRAATESAEAPAREDGDAHKPSGAETPAAVPSPVAAADGASSTSADPKPAADDLEIPTFLDRRTKPVHATSQ